MTEQDHNSFTEQKELKELRDDRRGRQRFDVIKEFIILSGVAGILTIVLDKVIVLTNPQSIVPDLPILPTEFISIMIGGTVGALRALTLRRKD